MLQERAFEESQKYKEGKYILEKAKLMKVCHPGLTLLCIPSCSACGVSPTLRSTSAHNALFAPRGTCACWMLTARRTAGWKLVTE